MGLRLLLLEVVLLIRHGIHLFRSTGGFTQMPGWDLNVTVGGYISYPSLKGGKNKRSRECKCSHTSSESRAQLTLRLLFASTHAEFLGKELSTFAFANCVKSRQGFGEVTRSCCRRGLPYTPFGSHTIRDLANEAVVPAGAQNAQVSENGNSARLSPAASESVRARRRCLLNVLGERWSTATNPGRGACSRGRYHKQEFQLRTSVPDPHAPADLNTFFTIYLPPVEIKPSLSHIRVWMLLETCEVIDEERVLLHVSLVTITLFHQSATIQIGI